MIVGLGNPGKEYAKTRHNIGFMVLDEVASYFNVNFKSGFKGVYGEYKNWLFLKPFTYMNRSGESVKEIVDFYKINVEDILVIHDDLDMDFGKIKFKKGGSDGGHNGIRSIINHLDSTDFYRFKIGISKPLRSEYTSKYVLAEFNSFEKKVLPDLLVLCRNAIQCFIESGAKAAMNNFNNKKIEKEDNQCRQP
ncbi:peptidyl-tRNA hydrolase, PTH1 family [Deferribacter desulfuricans SSM1]|uniref:Peptidyl-tRNA hydrolase n=1 Tax=Deferribacter desulfuricans (strain DSM 14783 / JCM 11476 / NBRC 101012 / SSM1) TaxID=639282 RepID=D3PBI3_DEFDS|nr:peptidyl-tRNA hydrolase, PTH1 family [Deferribacter desulfuricans SSM1]